MVEANARDPLIETLGIRRCTACDEDTRALSSELAPDASAKAFGEMGSTR